MPSPSENNAVRNLVVLACLIVVTAGLKAAGEILTPLLVSLFFSVLCIPPLNRLRRHNVPNGLAIAICILGATILLLLVTIIIGRSLAGFESRLPEYRSVLDGHVADLFSWLESHGIKASREKLISEFGSGAILDLVKGVATGLLAALSQIFLVMLTMIFMLIEASTLPSKLRLALGDPNAELGDWGTAMVQVQKYVAIKAAVSLATALCATLLTYALGVDFPLLWGLIAFLFNFIPNIGSIIAAIPPVLLALVLHGFANAFIVASGYLIINMVIGNFIEPRMMGRRLGLSTLVVFLSLIFWNWVWGPVGMVLSVPLTVIVKIILEHSEEFRSVAIMLGDETGEEPVTQ